MADSRTRETRLSNEGDTRSSFGLPLPCSSNFPQDISMAFQVLCRAAEADRARLQEMQEELACWIEKAEDSEKHNQQLQDKIADLQSLLEAKQAQQEDTEQLQHLRVENTRLQQKLNQRGLEILLQQHEVAELRQRLEEQARKAQEDRAEFTALREKHQRLQQQLASMLQQAGDTPRAGAVGASRVDTRDTESDKPQGTPNAPSYSSMQQQEERGQHTSSEQQARDSLGPPSDAGTAGSCLSPFAQQQHRDPLFPDMRDVRPFTIGASPPASLGAAPAILAGMAASYPASTRQRVRIVSPRARNYAQLSTSSSRTVRQVQVKRAAPDSESHPTASPPPAKHANKSSKPGLLVRLGFTSQKSPSEASQPSPSYRFAAEAVAEEYVQQQQQQLQKAVGRASSGRQHGPQSSSIAPMSMSDRLRNALHRTASGPQGGPAAAAQGRTRDHRHSADVSSGRAYAASGLDALNHPSRWSCRDNLLASDSSAMPRHARDGREGHLAAQNTVSSFPLDMLPSTGSSTGGSSCFYPCCEALSHSSVHGHSSGHSHSRSRSHDSSKLISRHRQHMGPPTGY